MMVVIPVLENGEWRAKHKPGGVICPNLSFDGEEASCGVRNAPVYEGSPCWTYGSSDVDPDFYCKKGKPCLIGERVRKAKVDVLRGMKNAGALQDLGRFPSQEEGDEEEYDDDNDRRACARST
jgi:hypothetical protein